MSETLFDIKLSTRDDAPRCRMCSRRAYWSKKRQEYLTYCGTTSCTNSRRICQTCGQEFIRDPSVGGQHKYCSPECRMTPVPQAWVQECAWCNRLGNQGARVRTSTWPYICQPCLEPIKHVAARLRAHHVDPEMARELIDKPGCRICGIDLLAPSVRNKHGRGDLRPQLVVDHDHACCPLSKSCGQCIRGFLCGQCNSAIGLLGDDPERLMNAARYLIGGDIA